MNGAINMDSESCPLCHHEDSTVLFKSETANSKFFVIQCRQCNLARTSPFPDDDTLHIHNKVQYYGKKKNKFLPIFQNIRDRLSKIRARTYLSMISESIKRPKILDIGCAEGRLLQSFLAYGCDCYGVEHPSYPQKRFLNPDRIKYFVGNLDFLDLEERSFDIIILWHVLEHMDNPNNVISRVYDLLAPDGIFVLAVPNFSGIEAKIFKQLWFHLDIPWHKYHFTKSSLQYLTEKNHFEIIKSTTFCIEQGVYGLLQSVLNAAGWPKNELYEAMKGNFNYGRTLSLIAQIFIGISILIPCFLISFLISATENGSVLKLILIKMTENKSSLNSTKK